MDKTMKSSKLGTEKIPKLLFSMSVPTIISMFVQSLYNIVDSFFVSQFSQSALDAVTVVFPMQMLILSFALGVGVGTNSLVAKYLGEKKQKSASEIATTSIFIALATYILFLLGGIFFSKSFVGIFTNDAEIIALGSRYLKIILCFSCFTFFQITLEKILQATGNMTVPMLAQLVGAIVNIILDPIMIFGLLGCPKMGIAGAAYATIIGQFCGMSITVIAFLFAKQDVKIKLNGFHIKKSNISRIMSVALPVAVMNSIGSITTICMNIILKAFTYGITILGLYFKLQSFVFMPVFGLMQGMLPIMSYNYGANRKDRFLETFKCAIITAITIMVVGTVLFMLFATEFMQIFDLSGEKLEMGAHALRIICWCFIPAAFGVTTSTSFQSIRCGTHSLVYSVLRQLVFIVPIAFVLSKIIGIDGVWLAYPISEVLSNGIFIPIYFKKVNKVFVQQEKMLQQKNS